MSYRQLDADLTIGTLQTLQRRIAERFPDSGLSKVCSELGEVARETRSRVAWIDQPHLPTRVFVGTVIVLMLTLAVIGVSGFVRLKAAPFSLADLVAVLDGLTNEIVVLGAALLFLFSAEARIKRTRALKVLHDLRAVAHVIDMHQLTKDPGRTIGTDGSESLNTESSPERTMTQFELSRYLDYCSEMLSLTGKLAALYAQSLPDPVIINAVNDIETLTTSLSRKVWQKIIMLEPQPGDRLRSGGPSVDASSSADG